MRENKTAYRILLGKPEGERDHLDYLGVDGTIILKLDIHCGVYIVMPNGLVNVEVNVTLNP
jgi:hypothetical protein